MQNQPTKAPLSQEEQNLLKAQTDPGCRNAILGLSLVVMAIIALVNLLLGSLDKESLGLFGVISFMTAMMMWFAHIPILHHRTDLQANHKLILQGILEDIKNPPKDDPAPTKEGQDNTIKPQIQYQKDHHYAITVSGQQFSAILANFPPVEVKQRVEIHYAPTSKMLFQILPIDDQPSQHTEPHTEPHTELHTDPQKS